VKQLVAAAVLTAALAASGCGSDGSQEESQLLPRALGNDFVRRTENVRATLEDGDGCTALDQAKQLRRAIARAIRQKRVPSELQDELRRRADELASSVVCVQPPPPPPPPIHEGGDDDGEDDEEDDRGKKDDRGTKGRGKEDD
jgi:hypothetical protein